MSERREQPLALAALDAAEKGAVLDELLRVRAELQVVAEAIARRQLGDATEEAVAEEVAWHLKAIPMQELSSRSGPQPWGYVEPSEAAWEILEETVEPWLEDVARLAGLGLGEAAYATGVGVLVGLYQCRDDEDSDRLLSWALDFPEERASAAVAALRKAGVEVPASELERLVPEWADRLSRQSAGR